MPMYDSPGISPADVACATELAASNINPKTGLATDYLNHFNEGIMLLEMIPAMPECAEDLLDWQPMSYSEHFIASNFKSRDLAIATYNAADKAIRERFDTACGTMTSILLAVRDAMEQSGHDSTKTRLAEQAVVWLKPLVAQAGAIINGTGDGEIDDGEPQTDVDLIMAH